MYGVRGNRVAIAVNGWFVSVCYIAIGWSAAALTGFALAERMGISPSVPVQVAVILVIAGLTVLLAVYGQATIARVYVPLSIALAVVFLSVGRSSSSAPTTPSPSPSRCPGRRCGPPCSRGSP